MLDSHSDADADMDKAGWRRRFQTARRSIGPLDLAASRGANAGHLLQRLCSFRTVCAFLPLDREPLDPSLLSDLVADGVRVLVPVVAADQPLDWVDFPTPTEPGSFGIAEPTGPRLGPDAVTWADAVVIPAFAVDDQGVRLGRGGGHYDRTLALLGSRRPELIAVLFEGERPAALPREPHDVPVTGVVTPSAGVRFIGSSGPL